jgi:phospholipid transport system transporter-binding protein
VSDAPSAGAFQPVDDGARWTYAGRLTFDNAEAALESSRTLPLPTRGIVDLGTLEHADSAALAVLLALRRRAIAEGGDLAFESVPDAIVSLARVYGVDTLVGV